MAGSNFIGVNLCFATGYSQTYIVDPLLYTYNVGDYVTIKGVPSGNLILNPVLYGIGWAW